jgi:hypothetical protein
VDVRLHGGGVDPELAAAGHLQRPGELDDTVVEGPERLGPDGVGPSDQRGVVGDAFEVDAAELPEYQAVVDEVLGLLGAPAVEAHHDQHAEDDLHRGGGPAARAGLGMTAGEIPADPLEELIVVEQPVELLELGLEAESEAGDQGEQIGPGVAVPEHGSGLPSARG